MVARRIRDIVEGLPLAFFLAVDFGPILKIGNEKLAFQLRHSMRESRLNVGHRAVVDKRADFFDKKGEQQPRRQVSDRLRHVFFKIALDRRDRVFAGFRRDFYHGFVAPQWQLTIRKPDPVEHDKCDYVDETIQSLLQTSILL